MKINKIDRKFLEIVLLKFLYNKKQSIYDIIRFLETNYPKKLRWCSKSAVFNNLIDFMQHEDSKKWFIGENVFMCLENGMGNMNNMFSLSNEGKNYYIQYHRENKLKRILSKT